MAFCLCWCVEPPFFSHLLLEWQKDEYLCSFLEAVPRLIIHHLLQPVFQLLLRLIVVIPFLLPRTVFNIASLSTWFRVSVSHQNFTDGFLLEFDFFPGYWSSPTMDCLIYIPLCDWAQLQKPNATKIRASSSDNKTDLTLRYDYCIKFQLFEGAQDVFSRLMAVCYMLLPHNPYRVLQYCKTHVYRSSCSYKHWFLWKSPIFER